VRWPGQIHATPIGVDVTPGAITLAQSAPNADGVVPALEHSAILDRPSGGPVSDAEAERVMGVLARRGFRGRSIVLGMSGPNVAGEVITLPPLTSKAPLDTLARAELARLRRWDDRAIECAWWALPAGAAMPGIGASAGVGGAAGPGAGATSAMTVGAQHSHVESLLTPWVAAGADVLAVDVRSLAIWRAVMPSLPPGRGVTSVVIDTRRDGATILIFAGRTLVYERSLSDLAMGKAMLLAAQRLGVEPAVVHELWCATDAAALASTPGGRSVLDVLHDCAAPTVRALAEEARVSGAYASGRFAAGDGPESVVLLTGDAAALPGFADLISREGLAGAALINCPPALLAARGLSTWHVPSRTTRARRAA
jgi:hypothetical protein